MYKVKMTVGDKEITFNTEDRKIGRAAAQVAQASGGQMTAEVVREAKPKTVKFKGIGDTETETKSAKK